MSRHVVLWLVGAAVVIGVAAAVAVYIPGEHATRVIAMTGVAIAAGKAAYDVWDKERERRKKTDESKEQYRVELTHQHVGLRRPRVGVEIYNFGKTNVHIRFVCLHLQEASTGWRMVPMITGSGNTISHAAKLEPKDAVEFYLLPADTSPTPNDLLQVQKDNMYIEAQTYTGVEVRVSGQAILEMLPLFMESAKTSATSK